MYLYLHLKLHSLLIKGKLEMEVDVMGSKKEKLYEECHFALVGLEGTRCLHITAICKVQGSCEKIASLQTFVQRLEEYFARVRMGFAINGDFLA